MIEFGEAGERSDVVSSGGVFWEGDGGDAIVMG